jgi:antitoxin VapB
MNTTVFLNNKTQAVRIPAPLKFDSNIKEVIVRKVGNERIITPKQNSWDSFFLGDNQISDDFLTNRAPQVENKRESFDD